MTLNRRLGSRARAPQPLPAAAGPRRVCRVQAAFTPELLPCDYVVASKPVGSGRAIAGSPPSTPGPRPASSRARSEAADPQASNFGPGCELGGALRAPLGGRSAISGVQRSCDEPVPATTVSESSTAVPAPVTLGPLSATAAPVPATAEPVPAFTGTASVRTGPGEPPA
jgi:hypothetical protein